MTTDVVSCFRSPVLYCITRTYANLDSIISANEEMNTCYRLSPRRDDDLRSRVALGPATFMLWCLATRYLNDPLRRIPGPPSQSWAIAPTLGIPSNLSSGNRVEGKHMHFSIPFGVVDFLDPNYTLEKVRAYTSLKPA
ncbi:hypothetical protein D9611_008953 [Ephemerocybe angulata]|uniref:Uncharacterized protein n=1 Tax=Ephemerocybe angulata TaxID=980116 RepID=A0A8H5BZ06_9AGAR|nr:hypothetical protein D9611_008953 [Tulosesus angulatus]